METAFDPQSGDIVDPSTLVFKRAVKDAGQAYEICKTMLSANRDRAEKQKKIMQKYNDEQPWDVAKLKAAGEGWRHNRSTGFLSTMLARVLPPYKQTISSARVLTSSSLNLKSPDSDQKAEDFRTVTTRTIRKWSGWDGFCHQLILEDLLFGYAACCWTDQWDWKPMFARTDDAIFPDGTPQDAADCPVWMLRQRFLIHELADKLADPQISSQAGWNIENVVKAINSAKPDAGGTKTQDDYRRYEDLIRETTVGTTYMTGTKQVSAYHLFAQEANGKVSHYIVNGETGDELFTCCDRFDSMPSCLTLFSIEIGNGKLHGSKGAGRRLYNTHVAIEQSRNLIADNLYLSGLMLLKASQQGRQQAAITVQHPICIVGERYEVIDQKFKVDVEAFFALDRHLTSIAELQIGAFMPGQLLDSSGEKRTASEINYVASIEQQIKEGYLRRFYGQFQNCIWEMQKRIYSVDNIAEAMKVFAIKSQARGSEFVEEKMAEGMSKILMSAGVSMENAGIVFIPNMSEAVEACLELLEKGLTPKEIYELAQCPSWESEFDLSSQNAQAIDIIVSRYKGDPTIKQAELTKRDISSKLGASVADVLMIPEEDNTEKAEATRTQIFEIDAMMQGDPIPVSPRDIDVIHLQVLQEKAQQVMQGMNPRAITPQTLNTAKLIIDHATQHVQSFLGKGGKKEGIAEAISFIDGATKMLDSLQASMPQQAQGLMQPPDGGQFAGLPQGAVPSGGVGTDPMLSEVQDVMETKDASNANLPLTQGGGHVSTPLSRGMIDLQPKVTTTQ